MTEEPEFFRAKPGGKVHVLAGWSNTLGSEDCDPASRFVAKLTSALRGICGTKGRAAVRDYVADFDDGELCARCHRLYTGNPADLFEHGQ